jgi:dipeptidyl aminopeptidase/acylaminoacyl peptidase
MLPAWNPIGVYHVQYGLNQILADQGYVVLSVNYRGGTGYGLRFREPTDFGAGGASEFQDVLAAAHYLQSRPDVYPSRIGTYGASYGGLMVALALSRASDLYAAGVDHCGVANWAAAFVQPGTPAAIAETAFRSSPIATVGQWKSPVLLIHADSDRVVPFGQTTELVEALRTKGDVDVELMVIPNEEHDLLRKASWELALSATVDFFGRRL